ncbi:MAG: dihydroorotate dehydrogenase, partial [Calditrichaeota bacterium]|nr:dihydroorotate dehydrogenase [Calditrichota bacterium]
MNMSITMAEMSFRTPLLTGSGTFGYGDEFKSLVDYNTLGGIVTKSVSLEPRAGNKPPRICETSGGIINSIGLANPGVDSFIANKVSLLPIDETRVFLSVVGNSVEDFLAVVDKFETIADISGYELNVSCPNVKRGGLEIGGDQDAVAAIVKAVRAITKRF